MLFAKLYGIPVVAIASRNSHYRKDQLEMLGQSIANFTHPFIDGLSDYVADTLEQSVEWAKTNAPASSTKTQPTKERSYLLAAIRYYLTTQLQQDKSMREIFEQDPVRDSGVEDRPIAHDERVRAQARAQVLCQLFPSLLPRAIHGIISLRLSVAVDIQTFAHEPRGAGQCVIKKNPVPKSRRPKRVVDVLR